MTQNIYDNEEFFAGYSSLPRSVRGLDGAPEWPALHALLPDLRGRSVIDLGCGYGWFCRWARENGASRVLGIDVSEKMLARARHDTDDAAITYLRADMEGLELPEGAFDLVYSSLALHYVERLAELLRAAHGALVPGGHFVCSVEHPVFTAPRQQEWIADEAGRKTWPIDRYLDEGPRSTDWLTKGVVKQHRMIGTYVDLLLAAGFTLRRVVEWGPTEAQVAAMPSLAQERERPPFLFFSACR
jgi:SAM-dependent methyltransferase